MEGKSKRSFPLEENCVTSNKIKRIKAHTNQMSNTMENVSISEPNLKHSKVQLSERDRKIDKEHVSLVEKMMPANIAAYMGQEHIIGPGTILSYLLEKGEIPSMIFWGPPGCGKVILFFTIFYIFLFLYFIVIIFVLYILDILNQDNSVFKQKNNK